MDELVNAAMQRWPNVPDCYGWLGLDDRGRWRLRDDAAQLAGSFQGNAQLAQGSVLSHTKLNEFISRNYAHDKTGRWYFQNGPQRVFVELKNAPWILRIDDNHLITTHTGLTATAIKGIFMDENEKLFFYTNLGLGLVHSLYMLQACEYIEKTTIPIENLASHFMTEHFHFVKSPQALSSLPD